MTLREYLKSIADVLRNNLSMGEDEKINAQEFTSHIDTVAEANWESGYNSGYERGHDEGGEYYYNEGYSSGFNNGLMEGKQAEYDAFWDAYQQNGQRTDYLSGFSKGWNDTIFKPKYDIRPVDAQNLFSFSSIKDLVGDLNKSGVVLDLSQATQMRGAFYDVRELETIPTVDTTAATDDGANGTFYYLFGNCPKLRSIEKVILKQSGSQVFTRPFNWTPELREVRFEGVIGQNGMNFDESTKLSKASIESVINALSTTTSGLTVTFSKTAVSNAFEGGIDGSEWQALIDTKPNWAFSLV